MHNSINISANINFYIGIQIASFILLLFIGEINENL